jgi:hypothetical protein
MSFASLGHGVDASARAEGLRLTVEESGPSDRVLIRPCWWIAAFQGSIGRTLQPMFSEELQEVGGHQLVIVVIMRVEPDLLVTAPVGDRKPQ